MLPSYNLHTNHKSLSEEALGIYRIQLFIKNRVRTSRSSMAPDPTQEYRLIVHIGLENIQIQFQHESQAQSYVNSVAGINERLGTKVFIPIPTHLKHIELHDNKFQFVFDQPGNAQKWHDQTRLTTCESQSVWLGSDWSTSRFGEDHRLTSGAPSGAGPSVEHNDPGTNPIRRITTALRSITNDFSRHRRPSTQRPPSRTNSTRRRRPSAQGPPSGTASNRRRRRSSPEKRGSKRTPLHREILNGLKRNEEIEQFIAALVRTRMNPNRTRERKCQVTTVILG